MHLCMITRDIIFFLFDRVWGHGRRKVVSNEEVVATKRMVSNERVSYDNTISYNKEVINFVATVF